MSVATIGLAPCHEPHQVRFTLKEERNHHARPLCLVSQPTWQGLEPGVGCFAPDAVRLRAWSVRFRFPTLLTLDMPDAHGWIRTLREHLDYWESRHERPDPALVEALGWMAQMYEAYGAVKISAQVRRSKGLTPSRKLIAFEEADPSQRGLW